MKVGEIVYDSTGWKRGRVLAVFPESKPELVNPYLDYVNARVIYRDGVYVVYR